MRYTSHIIGLVAGVSLLAVCVYLAHRHGVTPPRPGDAPAPAVAAAATGTTTGVPAPHAQSGGVPDPAAIAAAEDARTNVASPWAVHDLADDASRDAWSDAVRAREEAERPAAESAAAKADVPTTGEEGGSTYQFVTVRDGRVYVRATRNENAAISAAANLVRAPPYTLDGTGTTVAVWDAGSVRISHQEFTGRLTLRNSVAAHIHSTHVGGTIAAAGVNAAAKGMAPASKLDSYDWNFDTAEMITAAMATPGQAGKIQLSNHSYGFQAGWFGGTWYGTWSTNRESDSFGMYDAFAAELDAIAYNAPYYLHFKAAGNDRNDTAPSTGTFFTYFDQTGSHVKPYDPNTDPFSDNWDNGGYDSLPLEANAKNIMTVGAVNDAVSGGLRSLADGTMSSFSSWGPTDDGRIKPDLVANGVSLFSSSSLGDASYYNSSGTSMATPSAMGAAALLIQHYGRTFPGNYMRASMIKGLLLHTADDRGAAGPDYQFGWGLINAHAAVRQIDAHALNTNALRMVEDTIAASGQTNVYRFQWDRGSPIKATLCWTDPAGAARSGMDNRSSVLVHDLDLRVISPGGITNFPFVLSVTNPVAPATTGDNRLDNVEQVLIAAPSEQGEYEVRVALGGALTTGTQAYAMLIGGATVAPQIHHTALINTTNATTPYVVEALITSEVILDPGRQKLIWNTSGPGPPWFTNDLALVSNDLYRAEIPGQAQGTTVYYYLEAAAANGIVGRSPVTAPAQVHRFTVVEAFTLFVTGQPTEVPGVTPAYGFNSFPSGVTVHASAPYYSPPTNGMRDVCVGWVGCCGIPSAGTTNSLDFVIIRNAFLEWQWSKAYSLVQSSGPSGVINAESWWVSGTTGQTVVAQAPMALNGTNYMFAGWSVDGLRLPDATNRATNPAGGIFMQAPRQAVAQYLPETQDLDNDGVADWWEQYYFGGLSTALNVDHDGDGFSSLKEYQDQTDPQDAGSVPMPPSIAHTPLENPQGLPAPWAVGVAATDNDRVDQVLLEWRRNGGAWLNVTLALTQISGVYTGIIPAPGFTGDQFQYRLLARDGAGLQSAAGPYAFSVAYPVAMLSPADFGTLELPRNSDTREILTIGNAGHDDLTWTLRHYPVGLNEGAEQGTNGWTHGGTLDAWHIASWRAYSGTNAWYLGSDASRQYPDSVKAWLQSPPVLLGTNALFSFRQWLSTEALKDATHAWDGAIVELSTNHGASFAQIAPVGGYPYAIYGHSASAFTNETPCFAGTGGWQQVEFNLAAYAGQTVRLRLLFGADGFVVNEGWYVDDLAVTPYGGADDWISTAYSNGNIVAQDEFAVQVFARTDTLAPGEIRRAILYLESNDPLQPAQVAPIALHNISRVIEVSTSGAGTVTPPGPVWMILGQSTNFLIAAGAYHAIGDIQTNGISAGGAFGGTVTNFIWANIGFAAGTGTLHVVFAPDLTTNGVPLGWLVAYGLTNDPPGTEALADQDLDTMQAWEEYIAGTDPTAATSRLAIAQLAAMGTNAGTFVTMTWGSVTGRVYTIYAATNDPSFFSPLPLEHPATPPLNTYTGAAPLTGFFRLGVAWPGE